ncbi:hypothetical protein BT96DRAFT_857002 [Gymnopus androsaceus JB14]|uniref:RRM domain-containing protein n=1 Tax=Gymnopus androsaceus JB14 TaxID=1447944 RepID=A0A6A4HV19_9AGAR|nr:hypothetical protein BT96DRAFT_857002 [Gymnopus androsaceus JB14]
MQAAADALSRAHHILLKNVPVPTTTADLRRMLTRYNVQDVSDVAILYNNFVPAKQALITLARPNFLRDNLRALTNGSLSGRMFSHEAVDYSESGLPESSFGTGPHAGLDNVGKNVLLSSFYHDSTIYPLASALEKYKLAGTFEESVIPTATKGSKMQPISMLVKCRTESEAYRLARDLHMTRSLHTWSQLLEARIIH